MCYQLTELQADELITSIKELQEGKGRFTTIATGRIENIQEDLKRKVDKIDNEMQFMKDQLRAFFNTIKSKETKTQKSYSLLSGKLVYKKASQKIAHDEKQLINWAEQSLSNQNRYTSVVKTAKLDWSLLKKDLSISNGMIVNRLTGEVLENINGVSIEEVNESFDIR